MFLLLLAACATRTPLSPTSSRLPSVTPLPSTTPVPVSSVSTIPSFIPMEGERWIEIDLAAQNVRLMDERTVLSEYLAASGVNQSPETTTYSGVFRVQSKEKGPVESAPGVYVSDVVMFDLQHGNGFHSQPADKTGKILDSTLGRPVTAGCVRVGNSAAVFEFARLGMRVWIH